jgi:hypothetical protein
LVGDVRGVPDERSWVGAIVQSKLQGSRHLGPEGSALGFTQEEFAIRYQIPLGTLRDWEQGRTEPDQPARAYLKVIARDPERVHRMLNAAPR